MTVKYDISLDDLVAFQAHYMRNDRKLRLITKFCVIAVAALIFIVITSKIVRTGEFRNEDLTLLVIFLLLLYFFTRLSSKANDRLARKLYDQPGNSTHMGSKTLTFGAAAIEMEGEWSYTRADWPGIFKAGETPEHFFIYLSAVSAVIVPKRDLTDAEQNEIRIILWERGLLEEKPANKAKA